MFHDQPKQMGGFRIDRLDPLSNQFSLNAQLHSYAILHFEHLNFSQSQQSQNPHWSPKKVVIKSKRNTNASSGSTWPTITTVLVWFEDINIV